MTTSNYTLAFSNYPTAVAAAKALGFWDEEEDTLRTNGQSVDPQNGATFGWQLTEIGLDPITEGGYGTYDEEGLEITPPTRLSGYYVNVHGILPPEAEAFRVRYGIAGYLLSGTVAEAE